MRKNRIDAMSEKIESDGKKNVSEMLIVNVSENVIGYVHDRSIDQCVGVTCATGFPVGAGVIGVQWWLHPYQEFYHELAREHTQCLALTCRPKTLLES